MNIRISKTWEWNSGIVLGKEFCINDYAASIEMFTEGDNEADHRRALERAQWWFQDVLQDAVLIEYDDTLRAAYEKTGQRIIALPYTPIDHVILMMLYCKLNAIMEQRLVVSQIHLSSTVGNRVTYSHHMDDDLMGFEVDGWWCEHHPIWANNTQRPLPDSVINIDRQLEWHDLGLTWESEEKDSTVVDFRDGKK